ncbi:MAG: DUF692 family protein [Archangium sp.]|nr:DUF692 family protein [Archangium sp.]MDP3569622.1 DUF692 family protein [Archangium sp.]
MNALPHLGLGLSSNAQTGDQPRPYALLDANPGLFDYVEYSAPLDVAQARLEASLFPELERRRAQVPLVYHPVHLNLFGPELESAERLALAAAHVTAVGSPWVSNDVGWWHHAGNALPGYLYLSPPLTAEGLAQCVHHVEHVRDAMPVPLLIENPVVTTARGSMHVMDFMAKLSRTTGCPLLLDLGHLLSHQLTRGLGLLEGLDDFPWERVAQIHLAGGVVTGQVYADDHPQPIRDETWSLFDALRPRCTALRAITYEGDGHPEPVARRVLERLRSSISGPLSLSGEGQGEGQTKSPAVPLASAWSLFDEVHTTPGPELDYRLAVLAERLDAEVPLARAAVTPTTQSLAPFAASRAFREWFERGTRSIGDAFLNWALIESRRPELSGSDALISLELWARTTYARTKKPIDTVFPVDLTEAVHAVPALKRHLRGRGLLDGAGWAGLLQCARRAPRVPWPVHLSLDGARVVITPKS